MGKVKKGDVLRCTEVYSMMCKPDAKTNPNLVSTAWALVHHVQDLQDGRVYVHVNWLEPMTIVARKSEISFLDARYDRFTVVPDEEVPDRLWAVVAKRALLDGSLLTELTNGNI